MFHRFDSVYIHGYGAYIPTVRESLETIGERQGKDGVSISKSLGVATKARPQADEDTVTMSWEAANRALGEIDRYSIGSIYIGSESHPYAVKPSAGIVATALGLSQEIMAVDTEFACKAGSAAVQIVASQVEAGSVRCGLAIGADASQAKPGDILEFTAGAGAAAFVLGAKETAIKIKSTMSYTTDTPDFWRRAYQKYPEHAGRFTGEPGYFGHLVTAARLFMEKLSMHAADFDYVVFHMPNGKFPVKAAKMLGFTQEQLTSGLTVPEIGNPYSASSLIGLCTLLDEISQPAKILFTSYGSGSGSDCFFIEHSGGNNE